jgi:VWFA-related protein
LADGLNVPVGAAVESKLEGVTYLNKPAVFVLLVLLGAQEPIRVDVSVVTVGIRVTDSRGRDVTGLRAEHFSVVEDDVAQNIAYFSNEVQPIGLGVLLDSSSSMAQGRKIDRAKDAARALVQALKEGSEFFYIDFDDRVNIPTPFTSDRKQLESALEGTIAEGGTSLYDALIQGIELAGESRLPRQALVIISDGADQHSTHQLQELIEIVRESELQIYTIGYFAEEEARMIRRSGPRISLINGEEVDNPRLTLEKIAAESGALSFFPRSDEELQKAVKGIVDDMRTQYTIAFYPKSSPRSEGYHKLRVSVQGGNYNVRARPGYGAREYGPGGARPGASRAFERNVERREERLIYSDDFQNPESGWPQRRSAQYSAEGYRLAGENVVVSNGPVFRNFRASATLSIAVPPSPTDPLPRVGNPLPRETIPALRVGGGLLFRQDYEGYYAFLVFPPTAFEAGYVAAVRTVGLRSVELDRWPLPRKTNANYSIEVRCEGTHCDLYEGGSLVGRLEEVAPSEGRIGLLLAERGEAFFKRLIVEELD